ncbi:MAG TPA: hypothetical protein VF286_13415 [Acidiphilium sp.]
MNSDTPSSTPTPARTIEALIRLIEALCAIIGCWSGTGASNARQLARSVQTLRDLAEQVRAIHADRTAAATADRPEARRPGIIRHNWIRHHERVTRMRAFARRVIHLSAGGLLIAGNPATRAVHHVARAPP